jgi:hypothetical protein
LPSIGPSLGKLSPPRSSGVSSCDTTPENAKLYITEIRAGSILVQLKAFLEQASFLVDHVHVLAGFVTNLQNLVDFFSGDQH